MSAAAIIRSHSSTVFAIGFSMKTCLPAEQASTVAFSCSQFGSPITAISTSIQLQRILIIREPLAAMLRRERIDAVLVDVGGGDQSHPLRGLNCPRVRRRHPPRADDEDAETLLPVHQPIFLHTSSNLPSELRGRGTLPPLPAGVERRLAGSGWL